MNSWNVMIVTLGDHTAQAEAVCRRMEEAWSSDTAMRDECIAAAAVNRDALRNADAIVLITDHTFTQSSTLQLFDMLVESGLPMLALLDQKIEAGNFYEHAGAKVERWDIAGDRLCAILEGLLHRQQEIKHLRAEAALNQRFHGGLRGQIAKMHEELQLAAIVQREFLPRELPDMLGVEFAALWRPTNYVSGDIYDVIRLDDDHAGVFLADAVGHGVPAALMTMVICRSLQTKEIIGNNCRILSPAEVLSRLNIEMIRRQGRTTRFATAVYAVVDCRRRVVQLAGAGHPPPVRLSADGASHTLETQGGLLGVFNDELYDQIEFELELGDRLVFYTDGFEQAFPTTAVDSHKRRLPSTQYRDEFNQLIRLPSATEMVDCINKRLDDQTGSLHQVDDLTMICVHAGHLHDHVRHDDENIADHAPGLTANSRTGGLRLAS